MPREAMQSPAKAPALVRTGGRAARRAQSSSVWQMPTRTGMLYHMSKCTMAIETTYTSLRANLASVLDQVVDERETVVVR